MGLILERKKIEAENLLLLSILSVESFQYFIAGTCVSKLYIPYDPGQLAYMQVSFAPVPPV
jgi:hypothetical protein